MDAVETKVGDVSSPKGYKGFAAFHKYWGKKPIECLSYLVENLTDKGEIVLDPFLGSGLIAREAVLRNRRFIGIDVNPICIEIANAFLKPPSYDELLNAIKLMEKQIKPKIEESYQLSDGQIATHFLWDDTEMQSVWVLGGTCRSRKELNPASYDLRQFNKYKDYKVRNIRKLHFFTNSRINASPKLNINNIFSGRALYNIDLLLDNIKTQKQSLRRILLLILTAASGQMSKMVFAVSRRGKKNGNHKEGISVGSWVVGFWRPKQHFEINVWNCFAIRARKILKAIKENGNFNDYKVSSGPLDVFNSSSAVSLINEDCRKVLYDFPSDSVSLILTDPPHSDRIPYLELSELWNAILNYEVSFEDEIVVSNAKERGKRKEVYNREMYEFFIEATRV